MERSILRVRARPHVDPRRAGEVVCEVLRGNEVVATIYGTFAGVQIVSEHIKQSCPPFYFELDSKSPSFVLSLLRDGETCPFCAVAVTVFGMSNCPVCGVEVRA